MKSGMSCLRVRIWSVFLVFEVASSIRDRSTSLKHMRPIDELKFGCNPAKDIRIRRYGENPGFPSDIPAERCETCRRVFLSQGELDMHRKAGHGNGTYTCSQCPWRFSSKRNLRSHMKRHLRVTSYQCNHCNRTFASRGSRSLHTNAHFQRTTYTCLSCGKKFSQKASMTLHYKSMHERVRDWECVLCNKSFSRRSVCALHMRSHSRHRAVLTLKCSNCSKTFLSKQNLILHGYTHTGESPFRCRKAACKRVFAHPSNRAKHERLCEKINRSRCVPS